MENIKDWCISRQLWWGHRIPAYHCHDCKHIEVSKNKVDTCPKCNSTHMHQDEDTLDTWFSSALWPFSTLGWPHKTEDFEYFYPTTMLVTGYDIITFWVSKMIFSAIEHTGKVPFKDVYIHGLVRDSQGRKMSKSLGNGVDPLDVIDEYGTDALRFSLTQNISAGNDIRYMKEKVEAGANFANKIWNAARFALSYIEKQDDVNIDTEKLLPEDKWILTKLNQVIKEVTDNISNYEIGVALQIIYDFMWSDICDVYIEMCKPRLYDENKEGNKEAACALNYVLMNTLKLLHPYMPFITEEIYMNLRHDDESIMISKWPEVKAEFNFSEDKKLVDEELELIRQVRNVRAENNIPNSKKANAIIVSKNFAKTISKSADMICKMAYIESLEIVENIDATKTANMTAMHTQNIDAYLDLSSVIDKDKEREKLLEEKKKAESELARANKMLSNEAFVAKAPEKLIAGEKEKVKKYTEILEKIEESLANM